MTQGSHQKIVLSLNKVVFYCFALEPFPSHNGLMEQKRQEWGWNLWIIFDASEKVFYRGKSGASLFPSDNDLMGRKKAVAWNLWIFLMHLKSFTYRGKSGLHLARGQPRSAMSIQLCNCNAIGQPWPKEQCNTGLLSRPVQYNMQCNTMCSVIQCSAHIAMTIQSPAIGQWPNGTAGQSAAGG